jgi:flagellar basal body-associated protein FliL
MKPTAIDLLPDKQTKILHETPMANEGEDDLADNRPPVKKIGFKKIFLLGAAGLFLIAGGAGGAAYMGYLSIPLPFLAKESKIENVPPPPPSIGPMVKLNPLVINLKDEKGRHYVKVRIILEVARPGWVEEINARLPLLTDIVILTLSDKHLADLRDPGAKDSLKNDFLKKFNESLQGEKISQIYFDEFIYQ